MKFHIVKEDLTPTERIAIANRRSGGVEKRKEYLRKKLFGIKCPECGGAGEVYWDYNDQETESVVKAHAPCPKCKGTGVIKEQTNSGSIQAPSAEGTPTALQGHNAQGKKTIAFSPQGRKKKKKEEKEETILKRIKPKAK